MIVVQARTYMLRLLQVFAVAAALLVSARAEAAKTYFTTQAVLREFFPNSERVTFKKHALTGPQRAALENRLGYLPPKNEYVVFTALTGSRVDGYAVVDEERGQHELITFAVKLSPKGVVERQEVMVYRESYGEEIVDPRFKQQFVGKSAVDPVRAGKDVDVVTGATISSRAMATGVRRAIVLVDELVLKSGVLVENRATAGNKRG